MSLTQLAQQSYQASVKGAYRRGLAADVTGAAWNIFRVRNGPVLVTELWGNVTTIMAGAIVPVLTFDPDIGGIVAIATIMVTLNGHAPGTVYVWGGAQPAGAAPVPAAALGLALTGDTVMTGNFVILTPGILYFTSGVQGTGVIDWYINYIPCFPMAVIEQM